MTDLTDIFTEVSLQDALWLAHTRNYDRGDNRDMMLVAIFSDGLEIAWRSEGSGPYSDETPDIDWEPPTIWARKTKK